MKRFVLLAIAFLLLGAYSMKKQVSKSDVISCEASKKALKNNRKQDTTTVSLSRQDIRFGNWTEADWHDNEYFRILRKYFNDCYDGEIEDEDLAPYKSVLKSQFVIGNASPFIMGGMFVTIVFLDAPNTAFTTWIYSDVDEKRGEVISYEVRGFKVEDGPPHWTKEYILDLVKRNPISKLW